MYETKFFEINSNYTLAYIKNHIASNVQPLIIFIHGFRSDKNGSKSHELFEFATAKNLPFMSFDLRNHGESSGSKDTGLISDWLDDCLNIIDYFVEKKCILIGSSLGGWLMLLVAKLRSQKIHSLIGVAAAPDFTEDLIWNNLTLDDQKLLFEQGHINFINPKTDGQYFIEKNFILDARNHLLLNQLIEINCPIRLFHGIDDLVVPYHTSLNIADKVSSRDVEITIIKNGDHRLSTPENIRILQQCLLNILSS